LCIAKAAVDSHLSKHDQDHCGECNDIDYCGEPPVGSIECNRDTGTWTVAEDKVWDWANPTELIASDTATHDWLGWSVATSGNQVFAGSPRDDQDSGSVYVFELNQLSGNREEKVKLTASDSIEGAYFGFRPKVSGDILVVGAPWDRNYGAAYVFEKDPSNNWGETAKLTAIDGVPDHYFGYSVGVYGNRIVVGAIGDNEKGEYSGSAYVFENSFVTGSWSQSKLTASDGSSEDGFGHDVAMFGNRIVIGSPFDDDNDLSSGSAYVFEFNTVRSVWEEKAKLTASDAGRGHQFGTSVAIFEDIIVVGGYGHAYIFEWNTLTDTWDETANLAANNANGYFGKSVAIDNDIVIVGAIWADGIAPTTGAAYVFAKNEMSKMWEERDKLFANDGLFGDGFGYGVDISQDVAAVGSYSSDHSGLMDCGAVYVYGKY
jgi:hypothetical protein